MRERILTPWRIEQGGLWYSSAGAALQKILLIFFFSFSSVVALLVTGFGDPAPLFPFRVVQLYCSSWLPSDND